MSHQQQYHYPAKSGVENQQPTSIFDLQTSNPFPDGNIPSFHVDVTRSKTKRWAEAKLGVYDGDDWGAPDYSDDDPDEPGNTYSETDVRLARDANSQGRTAAANSQPPSILTERGSQRLAFPPPSGSGHTRSSSYDIDDEETRFTTTADSFNQDRDWEHSLPTHRIPIPHPVAESTSQYQRQDTSNMKALTPPERWIPSPNGKIIRSTDPAYSTLGPTQVVDDQSRGRQPDNPNFPHEPTLQQASGHGVGLDKGEDIFDRSSTFVSSTAVSVPHRQEKSVPETTPTTPTSSSPSSNHSPFESDQQTSPERRTAGPAYQPSTPSRVARSPQGGTPSPRANSSRPVSPSKLRHVFTAPPAEDPQDKAEEKRSAESPKNVVSGSPPLSRSLISSSPITQTSALGTTKPLISKLTASQFDAPPVSASALTTALNNATDKSSDPSLATKSAPSPAPARDPSASPTRSRVRGIADQFERRNSTENATISPNGTTASGVPTLKEASTSNRPQSRILNNADYVLDKAVADSAPLSQPFGEPPTNLDKTVDGPVRINKMPGQWPASDASSVSSMKEDKGPFDKDSFWKKSDTNLSLVTFPEASTGLNRPVLGSAPSPCNWKSDDSNATLDTDRNTSLDQYPPKAPSRDYIGSPPETLQPVPRGIPAPLNIMKDQTPLPSAAVKRQSQHIQSFVNAPSPAADRPILSRKFSWEVESPSPLPLTEIFNAGKGETEKAQKYDDATSAPSTIHHHPSVESGIHQSMQNKDEDSGSGEDTIQDVRRQTNAMLDAFLGDTSFSALGTLDDEGDAKAVLEEPKLSISGPGPDIVHKMTEQDPETPTHTHTPAPLRALNTGNPAQETPRYNSMADPHQHAHVAPREHISLNVDQLDDKSLENTYVPVISKPESQTGLRDLACPPIPEDRELKAPLPPHSSDGNLKPSPVSIVTSSLVPVYPRPSHSLDHVSKLLTFRQIMAIKAPTDRIKMYKDVRSQYAQADTGLATWLASTTSSMKEDGRSPMSDTAGIVSTSRLIKRASFGAEAASMLATRITSWGSGHKGHSSNVPASNIIGGGGGGVGGTISRLGMKSALLLPRIGTLGSRNKDGNAVDGGTGSEPTMVPVTVLDGSNSNSLAQLGNKSKEKGKVIFGAAKWGAKGLLAKGKSRFQAGKGE